VDNSQPTAAPAADLTILENKLGIGTVTPAFKLDVVGQVNGSGGLCMGGDCRTTWPAVASGPWTLSGTSVLYGDGNVGIGSASPAYKLDVKPWFFDPAWSTIEGEYVPGQYTYNPFIDAMQSPAIPGGSITPCP